MIEVTRIGMIEVKLRLRTLSWNFGGLEFAVRCS